MVLKPITQESIVACYQVNKKIMNCTSMVQMDEGASHKVLDAGDDEPSRPTSVAASLLKKSVSSLVVFSYLIISLSQSYAMDSNKVAPFGEEGSALKGSYSLPVKFSKNTVVPEELDSPTSVIGLLDQQCLDDIENSLGVKSPNKDSSLLMNAAEDHLPSQNPVLMQEGKGNEISRAQGLVEKNKRKIHPLQIEEADVEAGLATTLKVNGDEKDEDDDKSSVHSNDSEESPEKKERQRAIQKEIDAAIKKI